MSIDRWLGKQNVVYTYNGILSSLKKEGNSDTCYNMDEPWRHYAKQNKPVPKGQILYNSYYYEETRVVKFIETESRMVVVGSWENEMLLINRYRILVLQDVMSEQRLLINELH